MFSDSLPEQGHVLRLLAWARACFENPCLSVGMFSDSLPKCRHVFRLLAWARTCIQTPCLSAGMFSDSLMNAQVRAYFLMPCLYGRVLDNLPGHKGNLYSQSQNVMVCQHWEQNMALAGSRLLLVHCSVYALHCHSSTVDQCSLHALNCLSSCVGINIMSTGGQLTSVTHTVTCHSSTALHCATLQYIKLH